MTGNRHYFCNHCYCSSFSGSGCCNHCSCAGCCYHYGSYCVDAGCRSSMSSCYGCCHNCDVDCYSYLFGCFLVLNHYCGCYSCLIFVADDGCCYQYQPGLMSPGLVIYAAVEHYFAEQRLRWCWP